MKAEGRKGVSNLFFWQKKNLFSWKNKCVSKFAGTDKVGSSFQENKTIFSSFSLRAQTRFFLFRVSIGNREIKQIKPGVLHTLFCVDFRNTPRLCSDWTRHQLLCRGLRNAPKFIGRYQAPLQKCKKCTRNMREI